MFSIVTGQSRGNTLSINGVFHGESLLPLQSLVALRLEPFVGNSLLPPRLPLVSALTNGNRGGNRLFPTNGCSPSATRR